MKRYLLFCMESYYPSGGWDDFCGSYDTIEEAETQKSRDYWHVVDTLVEERHVVASGSTGPRT